MINSKASIKGVGEINLTGDKTVVTIKVTAENGSVQDYIVNIIKTEGANVSVNDIVASSAVPVSESSLF